jgi:hypothetical protein
VTGVEGGEQVGDLAAAHLADHQTVGAHPQRLAHQVAEAHRAGALHVGRPGQQPDDVRVGRGELRRVLAEHQPLRRRQLAQQRREQRGLARTGASAR